MYELLLNTAKPAAPPVIADTWDIDWLTLPFTINGHTSSIIGNKMYLIGGTVNGTLSGRVYEVDLTSKAVVEMAAYNAHRFAGAVVYNNRIYVYGGFETTYVGTLRTFEPATNTWGSGGVDGIACDRMGFATDGKLFYAAGGTTGAANVNSIRTFNPETRVWNNTYVQSAPYVALGTRSLVLNKMLYNVGGLGVTLANSFNRLPIDPQGSSQMLPPLSSDRYLHVISQGKGGIYLFAGQSGTAADALTTMRYDIALSKWQAMTPPGVAIGVHAAAATTDNTVYISGGQGAGGGNKIHRYHI